MRYDRSMAITKRHENILFLVRAGSHSSRKLAAELGVSEQTIYRDILFLKTHGHHIDAVRQEKGWAYKLSDRKQTAPVQGQPK
ncbi:helix-turn-helix domain-containing protein [Agrobacterium rhizogenes]|nr:helix-turn-helix domain-containing protein [Rhizobium rhizogenes]NTG58203.1 helix-turn-helix domain-containing protein [Rhizobium rhizogenes]NTH03828.1 helix-turn-helix domain-containing protein [Rhizobium rhizogenes]NTI59549.1 helix-turn-helix domain-containing protein [Rhizobium rhizogenes]